MHWRHAEAARRAQSRKDDARRRKEELVAALAQRAEEQAQADKEFEVCSRCMLRFALRITR
jgi:hypothetical protein